MQCLECSWAELLKRMQTAVDLDEVITAHSEFLDIIVTRCLLDPHSQVPHLLHYLSIVISIIHLSVHTFISIYLFIYPFINPSIYSPIPLIH